MHLMSLISPVDGDLAVVYSPLLPVPFRERLLDRGVALVETPDDEFDTMGTNVLALAPRRCLMLAGNPAHARRARARRRRRDRVRGQRDQRQGRRRTDLPDAPARPDRLMPARFHGAGIAPGYAVYRFTRSR